MKVSAVKVTLTESDVLSIIHDYLEIEGLKIENIEIKELIIVKGTYKKKITIPFEAKIGLGNIYGNIVNAKLFNINVSKIGILRCIRNLALKKVLSDFSEYGVNVDKDTVSINLDLISKFVPYLYFKLKKITVLNGIIEAEVEEVVYDENKKIPVISKNCEPSPNPMQDGYSKVRNKILEKVPDKYENVVKYVMLVPDVTALLWRLFKDKRVKIKVKMMAAGVVAYLANPIDILPDFIPLIGKIDDVAIAFFGLNAIINEVPEEIILENWQGDEDIILITKEAVSYISNIVGAQNVGKLLHVIKNIFKKQEKNVRQIQIKQLQARGEKQYNNTFEEERAVNEKDNNIH